MGYLEISDGIGFYFSHCRWGQGWHLHAAHRRRDQDTKPRGTEGRGLDPKGMSGMAKNCRHNTIQGSLSLPYDFAEQDSTNAPATAAQLSYFCYWAGNTSLALSSIYDHDSAAAAADDSDEEMLMMMMMMCVCVCVCEREREKRERERGACVQTCVVQVHFECALCVCFVCMCVCVCMRVWFKCFTYSSCLL